MDNPKPLISDRHRRAIDNEQVRLLQAELAHSRRMILARQAWEAQQALKDLPKPVGRKAKP